MQCHVVHLHERKRARCSRTQQGRLRSGGCFAQTAHGQRSGGSGCTQARLQFVLRAAKKPFWLLWVGAYLLAGRARRQAAGHSRYCPDHEDSQGLARCSECGHSCAGKLGLQPHGQCTAERRAQGHRGRARWHEGTPNRDGGAGRRVPIYLEHARKHSQRILYYLWDRHGRRVRCGQRYCGPLDCRPPRRARRRACCYSRVKHFWMRYRRRNKRRYQRGRARVCGAVVSVRETRASAQMHHRERRRCAG
mmetsp:Transcript_19562/g.31190  ORF Transcript_19562/g.31190 Transcript_19562/m.31190 type:complete len:249 (+) Transcript_19562:425-1171(+)